METLQLFYVRSTPLQVELEQKYAVHVIILCIYSEL
jgi:hypothetical protein